MSVIGLSNISRYIIVIVPAEFFVAVAAEALAKITI